MPLDTRYCRQTMRSTLVFIHVWGLPWVIWLAGQSARPDGSLSCSCTSSRILRGFFYLQVDFRCQINHTDNFETVPQEDWLYIYFTLDLFNLPIPSLLLDFIVQKKGNGTETVFPKDWRWKLKSSSISFEVKSGRGLPIWSGRNGIVSLCMEYIKNNFYLDKLLCPCYC